MSGDAPGPTMDRRRFVGVALAAGTAGAAVAAGALTLTPLSRLAEGTPRFDYRGLRVLPGSKAPRGIPLVPVRVDDSGRLTGVPDRLEWYRYCGLNNAPGLREGFATDNVFRYHAAPQVLRDAETGGDAWWKDLLGRDARVEDFSEVGKGAPVIWRSEGQEAANPLSVLLIRVDASVHDAETAAEFFPDGILAAFGTCAHFCCAPAWRTSRTGYAEGHWDHVVCHCHGSWYDPGAVETYPFPPTG